jgi:site-specific recombinase XerD
MDPLTRLSATPKAWLLNSVLAPHADDFIAHLKRGRYSPTTTRTYLGSLAHLARWMTQCCLPLRLLDEREVERFLSPHTIRHTTAMHLLQSGVDISVIALWLGHESPTTTHHYVEADLAMKDRALAKLQDPKAKLRRYRAPDSLLEFLKGL